MDADSGFDGWQYLPAKKRGMAKRNAKIYEEYSNNQDCVYDNECERKICEKLINANNRSRSTN